MTEHELRKYSLNQLKKIIDQNWPDEIKIFLFGSIPKNCYLRESDIDIGFFSKNKDMQPFIRKIILLVENSDIPYNIDFVDFEKVTDDFKRIALQKVEKW